MNISWERKTDNWSGPFGTHWWAFDEEIQQPSTCYFHRWSLGQYIDGEADLQENGDKMLEGSSMMLTLYFR